MKAGEIWIQYLLSLVPDGEWQHITFTVPGEFWPLIYHNRWLLAEMSRLAADVILETGRRDGFLPGCFAVIHTWGRDQQWHPHVHLSTTAGGVTDSNTWKKRQFYARNVMPMWRYRITDLLRREYWWQRAVPVVNGGMSEDEFMERFSWHVPEKRFRMVRYY